MKINKAIIKNIQSIKNASIDFDLIEDTSDGVFLIVGPTGSGKTTILDAITLGIFGSISRLTKVSSTDINKDGSVVTLGQNEASVDITYTVNGQQYHSRWEIRTKPRVGGFDHPKMELRDQHGQLIENKISEVQKKNVEIIGLNATQFTRTILLAQGDFSAFLKANFSDKADILEKITGTGIYSTMGKAIFDNYRAVEGRRNTLRDDIERLAIMPEAVFLEKNETLKQNDEKIRSLNELYKKIVDDINIREMCAADEQRLDEEQKMFEDAATTLQQLKTNYGPSIQLFNNVQQGRTQFFKFESAHNNAIECEKQESNLLQIKRDTRHRLSMWTAELQKVMSDETAPDRMMQQLESLREEVNKLQRLLSDNNQKIYEIRQEITANYLKINLPGIAIPLGDDSWHEFSELINKQYELLEVEIGALTKVLEGTEISENKAEEVNSEIQHWTALKPLVMQFINDNNRKETLKKTNIEVAAELHQWQQKAESTLEQLTMAKATLADKKLIFEQNERIKDLAAHRHDLKDGQPCPLCGALEGPFREQLPPLKNQLIEDYKIAEKNCEKIENNHREIEKSIQITTTKISEGDKSILQLETDMQSKHDEIIWLKGQLGYDQPIGNNKSLIDEKIALLQLTRERIKRAHNLAKQLEQLHLMSADITRLRSIIDENHQVYIELENLYPINEPVEDFYVRMTEEKKSIDIAMAGLEGKLEEIFARKKHNEAEMEIYKPGLEKLVAENLLSGLEALKEVFDGESTVRSREKEIADNEKKCAGKRELIRDLTHRIKTQNDLIDHQITVDDQIQSRDDIDREKLSLSDENGLIKAEIGIHLQNEAKSLQIHRELESVNAQFEISKQLNTLIGSADGAKFKKIAQKNTLFHLTLLANHHLANMSDRYRFEFKQEELWSDRDNIDLMVVDLYSNSLRSCATLSGGETFIASLGLALGLSDFASRNNRIESLFIDEGFGTLDPDTLELAIKALEDIQRAGGKTICLITHVEAMKERIPYHLRVKKGADGSHTVDFSIA